jgi:hypothetical protein
VDPILAIMTAVVVVVGALVAFLPRSAARQARTLTSAARDSGLALTSEVEPLVLRRSRRAERYSVLLAVVGWVAAVWSPLTHGSPVTGLWFILSSMALGGALGAAVAALVDAHGASRPDWPRLARTRVVAIADYLPALERRSGAIALLAIALGAGCCSLAGVHDPIVLIDIPVLVGLSALVPLMWGRYLVSRPQHARTTVDLAWDDALRAKNLRALFEAAPTAGLYGALAMIFAVSEQSGSGAGWGISVFFVAMLPPVLLLVVRTTTNLRAGRYYLRRLWPETAAELDLTEQITR